MLIGILGYKFSGKDTTADYLVKKYDFTKISFAQPLKDICKILFNFDDEQLYGNKKEVLDPRWGISPRTAFQYIGTDMFRNKIKEIMPNVENNFWVNLAIDNYKNIIKNCPTNSVVIADVRFQNEIDAVKNNGGIIIKIVRPTLQNNDQHASENIGDLEGDFEILNDGTLENLYSKIDGIFNSIM